MLHLKMVFLLQEFIRINPDKKDFNIFKTINEIHRQIKNLTKKS